jgi:hypothetical protein
MQRVWRATEVRQRRNQGRSHVGQSGAIRDLPERELQDTELPAMNEHQVFSREFSHPTRGLTRYRLVCECGFTTDWQTTSEFATQQLEHHRQTQLKEN